MRRALSVLVILLSVSLGANAQFFVGGGLNFGSTGGKIEANGNSNDKDSQSRFNFAPMGGMFLSEKLMVGVSLGYGFTKDVDAGNVEVITKHNTFSFTPFVRYYAFKINKLSLFAQGNAGYSGSSQSTKTGTVTVEGAKVSQLGISAFPGVSYDLLEWLSLEATINGFAVGASTSTSTLNDVKNTTNNFQFGIDSRSIVTSGAINVGAIVKF